MAENKWVTGVITPYNKWSYFTLPGTQMFFFLLEVFGPNFGGVFGLEIEDELTGCRYTSTWVLSLLISP